MSCILRNLLVKIKYDGSNFCGWQVQRTSGGELRTVQYVFQQALWRVLGEDVPVKGCSRTDSGVHANEFCVSFRTNSNIPCERIPAALNSLLPRDIAAFNCRQVADDFHARYDCIGKQYRYLLLNSQQRDPFWRDRALWYKYPVRPELMDVQARDFIGTQDFSAFCSANSDVKDKVRTVSQFEVRRLDDPADMVEFTVTADGFLYNMVRIMVGTLLDISSGRLPQGEIPAIIASRDRSRAGATAAPCGLYLNKV